jgi:uroporphyrinogen decarboxylase
MPLKNDRLIRALLRQPTDATPVWLMRQAGRYLPEYRQLRAKFKDFVKLCKTPEAACEVTLQPVKRFDLDAAIIFSDILTIPDAMGLGLSVQEKIGPQFQYPLRTEKDLQNLRVPDIENDLGYVLDAIRLVKNELTNKIPLIGFAGSPWTLATYMIEGGSFKDFALIKQWLYLRPQLLEQLLTLLANVVSDYLYAQIAGGADVVMIFDTWGGILTPRDYQRFSLSYMTNVVNQLKRQQTYVPVILFTKNSGQWLEVIATSGCDAIGLDWMTDIGEARQRVGNKVALQGNIDPLILFASPDRIIEEVAYIKGRFGSGPGHVFNLGHGVLPATPYENVKVLVDAVHTTSLNYNFYHDTEEFI